jgi:hypothetical protein
LHHDRRSAGNICDKSHRNPGQRAEETAFHRGHLDIARELLDGQANLGLR